MKRSRINQVIKDMEQLIKEHGFEMPPFAAWTAKEWQSIEMCIRDRLKPILVSLLMLDFVWTLQQFALIWMTTGGGPINATETISTYILSLIHI